MTPRQLLAVALLTAWAAVSGFCAGAARVYGEVVWLQIIQGERKGHPASRRHYLWSYPVWIFFAWPLVQLGNAWRRDRERRRQRKPAPPSSTS